MMGLFVGEQDRLAGQRAQHPPLSEDRLRHTPPDLSSRHFPAAPIQLQSWLSPYPEIVPPLPAELSCGC